MVRVVRKVIGHRFIHPRPSVSVRHRARFVDKVPAVRTYFALSAQIKRHNRAVRVQRTPAAHILQRQRSHVRARRIHLDRSNTPRADVATKILHPYLHRRQPVRRTLDVVRHTRYAQPTRITLRWRRHQTRVVRYIDFPDPTLLIARHNTDTHHRFVARDQVPVAPVTQHHPSRIRTRGIQRDHVARYTTHITRFVAAPHIDGPYALTAHYVIRRRLAYPVRIVVRIRRRRILAHVIAIVRTYSRHATQVHTDQRRIRVVRARPRLIVQRQPIYRGDRHV